jgi:glutamate dehydrogenase
MRILETENALSRDLEGLPDDEALERRRARSQGMTRPELSALLGYSKIALYEKILSSTLPDAPSYRLLLEKYFPQIIQERFTKEIHTHPLRREITATVLTNEIINRVGPMFVYEVAQTTGGPIVSVVKAFFLACKCLDLNNLWDQIDSLDALMVSEAQTFALIDINKALEEIVLWFLRHPHVTHSDFKDLQTLLIQLPSMLHGEQQHLFEARLQGFVHMEVPQAIAQNLSLIPFYPYLLDILSLSIEHKDPTVVAQTYFTVRSKIGLDWLMTQAEEIHTDAEWQRSARTSLIDDLIKIQAKLTHSVMTHYKDGDVEAWMRGHEDNIHHVIPILAQIKNAGRADLGMLGYVVRQLQNLG